MGRTTGGPPMSRISGVPLRLPTSKKVKIEQALARLCTDLDVSVELVRDVADRLIQRNKQVDTAGYTE